MVTFGVNQITMSKTHSPGPWRVGKKQERAILDANGSQIAVIPDSLKPDAALIAAAPEMYSALVKAYFGTSNPFTADVICNAISKAEGRGEGAFVNWFKIRRHAKQFEGGDVCIPYSGGQLRFAYAEIMERAAVWDNIIAKAEGNVKTEAE